jgi:hypothetical protein
MATTIAIMIGTPDGARLLAFSSERDAAQAAETILRRLPREAVPAPVWIACRDRSINQRLTDYLEDVQAELVGL